MKRIIILLGVFIFSVLTVSSRDLKISSMFTDNMVLQQCTSAPIWGQAKKDSEISVVTSWDEKAYSTRVGADGKWILNIHTPAAGGPYSLTITDSETKLEINDVYIGEVWVASGQSNMSMPLKGYDNQPIIGATEEILNSARYNIRFLNVPSLAAFKPLDDHNGDGWHISEPGIAGECTAVGWFFARKLEDCLGVPVGIINVSYGGSSVEAWMPADACREFSSITVPELSDHTDSWLSNVPSTLFNGMMNPVIPFAIKGFLWYQGESNIVDVPHFTSYTESMVRHWRKKWNACDLPFYFVQIAPYDYLEWTFFTPQWPEISAYLRDEQRRSLDVIPSSGMAVTLDIGEENCIHPRHKKEVGERLAYIALSRDYGISGFEAESPEFDYLEIDNNKAILHFKKGYCGLTSFGKELSLFEIAGENHVFVPAEAHIDEENSTVIVYSRLVKTPAAVRYAFKNWLVGDLFGTGGLPVGTFRTDDWK